MRRFLALFLLAFAALAGAEDHVRFIVTGDGRGSDNGVNAAALGRLVKAIVAEKPDALLYSGDLVAGASTDKEELSQFKTWQKAMGPIYDAGIKVLACRGNHEMRAPHSTEDWKSAMSGRYASPGEGPAGEEGMTYAYTVKNVTFIALDQFGTNSPGVDQKWLDALLAKEHALHVFAFAHKMAFFSGAHTDGLFTTPDKRDALMKSLHSAGCRAVFFGHDHLYDHAAVSLPGWKDEMHQFVVGTAGAPFYKSKQLTTTDRDWKISRIKHVEERIGYCVVDVVGEKVTVVFKAETSIGVFEPVDSVSWIVPLGQSRK